MYSHEQHTHLMRINCLASMGLSQLMHSGDLKLAEQDSQNLAHPHGTLQTGREPAATPEETIIPTPHSWHLPFSGNLSTWMRRSGAFPHC